MLGDLRHALRSLRCSPGFTATAVLTLALGIGATTAVYSVVYAVVFRPLPYPDADRILAVLLEHRDGATYGTSPEVGETLVAAGALESMALTVSADARLIGEGEPETLSGASVTSEFFRVLTQPALGRGFTAYESHAIVITHGLWQRRFAGDPRILGRQVTLEPDTVAIVGVMPPEFRFGYRVEFFRRLTVMPGDRLQRGSGPFEAFGRLPAGTSMQHAEAAAEVVTEQLRRAAPAAYEGLRIRLMPYQKFVLFEIDRILLLLLGAVGFVLLIACTNVSTLLLVRSSARARELAVRASLGASRLRLVRQQLGEGMLLAIPSAALGTALAFWMLRGILVLIPEGFPRIEEARIDAAVLMVTIAVSMLASVAASLAPALSGLRIDIGRSLSAAPGLTTSGRNTFRLNALIGIEVALTMVLLAGAGVLIVSLYRLSLVDPGLRTMRFVTAHFFPGLRYRDTARKLQFYEHAIEQVRAIPGVRAVTFASRPPLHPLPWAAVSVNGKSLEPIGRENFRYCAVQPEYFDLIGTPILRGRNLTRSDRLGAPRVAIVNEAALRLFSAGFDPVGHRVKARFESSVADLEIVGVARNIREHLWRPPRPEIFLPLAQHPPIEGSLLVFAEASAAQLEGAIKEAVWRVDPAQPVDRVKDFEDILDDQARGLRFQTLLFTGFACSGLLLALVGIWAVVAYAVVRRTREIGIRGALGARPRQVLWLMIREVLTPVAIGAAVGLIVALNLSALLQHWMFEVQPNDPRVLAAAATLLAAAAIIAAALPARCATRIDPAVTLRQE